jgi:hypothetical protein
MASGCTAPVVVRTSSGGVIEAGDVRPLDVLSLIGRLVGDVGAGLQARPGGV